MELYLYGAGIVAYGIRCALKELWGVEAKAHIVTEALGGQGDFEGRPVIPLGQVPRHIPEGLILVATPPEYQGEIAHALAAQTSCPYLLMDNHLQFALMGAFYKRRYGFRLIGDLPGAERMQEAQRFEVYMARSSHDKPLRERVALPAYVMPVQAGAALDAERMVGVWHDDEGENISARNRDFSEMTVAYWAWRNRSADWQGLCHYRRVLGLSEPDYAALDAAGVDAVLPLPYFCAGDASFQYGRYLAAEDTDLLYSVLDEGERSELRRELARPYLYNHNLLLARGEVFSDYCRHVFSVLMRVEEAEGKRPPRNDRHMGYLAEILTSAYFTSRADRLHIVHAPELWLV